APAPPESSPSAASPAAFEPQSDRDLERAGKERQQLGSEAGMKSVRLARSNAHQSDRRRTAKREPEQRLRADETGGSAEQRGLALDVGAQERVAIGPEQRVDRPRSEQMDTVHR